MKRNKYTAKYFLKKFKKTPPRDWGRSISTNCVLAQCGVSYDRGEDGYTRTPEADALSEILFGIPDRYNEIANINDRPELTPKQNIIKALKAKLA